MYHDVSEVAHVTSEGLAELLMLIDLMFGVESSI